MSKFRRKNMIFIFGHVEFEMFTRYIKRNVQVGS